MQHLKTVVLFSCALALLQHGPTQAAAVECNAYNPLTWLWCVVDTPNDAAAKDPEAQPAVALAAQAKEQPAAAAQASTELVECNAYNPLTWLWCVVFTGPDHTGLAQVIAVSLGLVFVGFFGTVFRRLHRRQAEDDLRQGLLAGDSA